MTRKKDHELTPRERRDRALSAARSVLREADILAASGCPDAAIALEKTKEVVGAVWALGFEPEAREYVRAEGGNLQHFYCPSRQNARLRDEVTRLHAAVRARDAEIAHLRELAGVATRPEECAPCSN